VLDESRTHQTLALPEEYRNVPGAGLAASPQISLSVLAVSQMSVEYGPRLNRDFKLTAVQKSAFCGHLNPEFRFYSDKS
jgi:hypothetical protein